MNEQSESDQNSVNTVDLSKAFFSLKNDPTKTVVVKQPLIFFSKVFKQAVQKQIAKELASDDSKVVSIVDQDPPKIRRKRKARETKKKDVADSDYQEKDTKKLKRSCKWCNNNGHEDTAEGHNSRGCKKKKTHEAKTIVDDDIRKFDPEDQKAADELETMLDVGDDIASSAIVQVAAAE